MIALLLALTLNGTPCQSVNVQATTTTLDTILEGETVLVGLPATGVRYATHVGEWNGQTWFRWQFSGVPDEFYDVMYFDQNGELRYYQTVTPTSTTTYPYTISYGSKNPSAFEVKKGNGPIQIVNSDGTTCSGTVDWITTSQRAGDVISVTTRHTVRIDIGACLPDPDYIEHWVFDASGPRRTMGPGWMLERQ